MATVPVDLTGYSHAENTLSLFILRAREKMNQPIPNGIEIADGINLAISETGAWVVQANYNAFPSRI